MISLKQYILEWWNHAHSNPWPGPTYTCTSVKQTAIPYISSYSITNSTTSYWCTDVGNCCLLHVGPGIAVCIHIWNLHHTASMISSLHAPCFSTLYTSEQHPYMHVQLVSVLALCTPMSSITISLFLKAFVLVGECVGMPRKHNGCPIISFHCIVNLQNTLNKF